MIPNPVTCIVRRMLPPTATLVERRQAQLLATALLLGVLTPAPYGVLYLTLGGEDMAWGVYLVVLGIVFGMMLPLVAFRRIPIKWALYAILCFANCAMLVPMVSRPEADAVQLLRLLGVGTVVILIEAPTGASVIALLGMTGMVVGQLLYGFVTNKGVGSTLDGLRVAEGLVYPLLFLVGSLASLLTRERLLKTVDSHVKELQRHQDFEEAMHQFLFHELRNPLVVAQGALHEACRDGQSMTTAERSLNVHDVSSNDSDARRSAVEISEPKSRVAPAAVSMNSHDEGRVSLMRAGLQATESIAKLLSDVQEVLRLRAGGVLFMCDEVPLRDALNACVSEVVSMRGMNRMKKFSVTWEGRIGDVVVLGDRQAVEKVLKHLVGNALKFSQREMKIIVNPLPTWAKRHGVEVIVQNDGAGMSEAQVGQAFDMFLMRSHRRGGGSGLGLVECKLLTEAIGGELLLESKDGETRAILHLLTTDHAAGEEINRLPSAEAHHAAAWEADDGHIDPMPIAQPSPSNLSHKLSSSPRLADDSNVVSFSRVDGPNAALVNMRQGSSNKALSSNPLSERRPSIAWNESDLSQKDPLNEYVDEMHSSLTLDRVCRVLFVDDVPMNRVVGVRMLKLCVTTGYKLEIDTASDGKEAVEKFKDALESMEGYDVVFMDVTMPVMNGWEATEEIRKLELEANGPANPQRCVVVAVTGNTLPADVERCLDAGMDDVFFKPYKLEQLRSVLWQQ